VQACSAKERKGCEVSAITQEGIRQEFSAWVDAHWDEEIGIVAWRDLLVASGWAVPSWPERWFGKGLPVWADQVVAGVIREKGVVGPPIGGGMNLAAPTILVHGSDEVKEKFLRPTLVGEVKWCQLFSEPGAGSDLASLSASAVRDGDEWVVNGQKVWNTSAQYADLGMLVVRTNWDRPKHHGISYFVLPMQQAGVDVRPIHQMNYHSSFNEVFLTDARVPAENLVGDTDDGWRIARTTLAYERTFNTLRRPNFRGDENALGRTLREAKEEAERHFTTYVWYPQRAGRPDLAIERARDFGDASDLVVRQAITQLYSFSKASEWTSMRAQAARALGRAAGPEGSLGKLAASEVARMSNKVHTLISGTHGVLKDGDNPLDAVIAEVLISTPAQSIAGGTDEIQRNIIGEKILGLSREPEAKSDK
jgi:alkylation response protein AidB-like acyl-CoA dehydrogenase